MADGWLGLGNQAERHMQDAHMGNQAKDVCQFDLGWSAVGIQDKEVVHQ